MTDIGGLERLIEPEVRKLGYDVVRVMMTAFGPGFTCAGLLLHAA